MPSTLAVSIICKNAAGVIGPVLRSVRGLVDDPGRVVAFDSGSTDGTLELLARAGARVERVAWRGYLRTKQEAIEACADADWVLCLDADEPVEPDLARSLAGVLASPPAGVAGLEVNRKIFYRGRFLEHAWQPEWRLRVVRGADVRAGLSRWAGVDPHPFLEVNPRAGRVQRLAGTLRHDAFTSFDEFLERQVRHARDSAQALAQRGVPGRVSRLVFSPVSEFLKQVVLRGAWRDGRAGWMAAGSSAIASALKHVMLLERTQDGER